MPRLPPELSSTTPATPKKSDPFAHVGQAANIAEIDALGFGEWTILYKYKADDEGSCCLYSALMEPTRIARALNDAGWDLLIEHCSPGFTQRREGKEEIVTYDRFGFRGVEPVLYVRSFHGIFPRQFDLSEEFRLFHNLYHDRHNDRFIITDDRGRETVAAEITDQQTRVLTRLLRQYMAARQLALGLFFDNHAHADVDIDLANKMFPQSDVMKEDRRYSFHVGDVRGQAFSRLVGKKIISPPPMREAGIWPFAPEKKDRKYAEFIIGVDENGAPVKHSCDHDALANYFGANEDAPHYLTPVWFRREVLAKYYDDPGKFSVEDGYLRCGSLWGIQIDNNLPDHVVVYLGDLGRDLDYEEQLYWKHFNVTSGGNLPSDTNFKRSFLAQFTDATAPDLVFKRKRTVLNETWIKKFGYPLFRDLHESDAHIIKQLRVPISETIGEFESQTLFLVKLQIDYLNEIDLAKACGGALSEEKGISKFERFLRLNNYPYVDRDVSLLRQLQNLRSSGAVHAKGSRFDKIRADAGLDVGSPRDVFRDFLDKTNQMLVDLAEYFNPED